MVPLSVAPLITPVPRRERISPLRCRKGGPVERMAAGALRKTSSLPPAREIPFSKMPSYTHRRNLRSLKAVTRAPRLPGPCRIRGSG
jgi:hypothetical protein